MLRNLQGQFPKHISLIGIQGRWTWKYPIWFIFWGLVLLLVMLKGKNTQSIQLSRTTSATLSLIRNHAYYCELETCCVISCSCRRLVAKKFPALSPIGHWVISRDWGLYLIFPRFSPIMWLVLPFNIANISTHNWFRIHFNAGCNKINLCKSRRSICFKILTVSRYHRALSFFSLLKFVKRLNINCVQRPWF